MDVSCFKVVAPCKFFKGDTRIISKFIPSFHLDSNEKKNEIIVIALWGVFTPQSEHKGRMFSSLSFY